MNDKSSSLIRLMFNAGEYICVSDSQFANNSLPLEEVCGEKITLISTNSSVANRSINTNDLIFVSLNPMKENSPRRDGECMAFRNFLVELDNYERTLQIGYLKKIGIPYSAMVWSGSKSTHTLITLSEDLKDEKTYRFVYKWILNIVSLSDQALGNPSRSIRLPGAIRPETGNEQELIELKERVTHTELFAWLNQYPHLMPKPKEKKVVAPGQEDFDKLSNWARYMLVNGVEFGNRGRNQTYYALAMDLGLAGFSEDSAIEILSKRFTEEHDFKEKEFLITIGSAFKRVNEGRE